MNVGWRTDEMFFFEVQRVKEFKQENKKVREYVHHTYLISGIIRLRFYLDSTRKVCPRASAGCFVAQHGFGGLLIQVSIGTEFVFT